MTRMANPYVPRRARIESIRDECGGPRPVRTFRLAWADEPTAPFDFLPGQCVELSVIGVGEIFLSIASAAEDGDRLELSVMRVGRVTSALHALEEGEIVGLRGPYGNGFPVAGWHGSNFVLIGGGIGQAPLRSLLHHVLAHRDDYGRIQVFHGARSPEAMIYRDELEAQAASTDLDVYLTIDWKMGDDGPLDEDAREGWPRVALDDPVTTEVAPDQFRFTGFVPQVVDAVSPSCGDTIAVTCGPPVMIGLAVQSLERLGFRPEQIYTTLERRMKCGIGLCGRCNLGPQFVCTDGPVFSQQQLLALPEAFA